MVIDDPDFAGCNLTISGSAATINAYPSEECSKSISELVDIYNQKLKRRSQIKSEITPRANGTYTVTLAFNDDADESILKMELMVPGEVMAQDLAKRFRENAEQLYSGVLNALFEEPKA